MATQFTANYGFPYPDGSSSVVVHTDLKGLADKSDVVTQSTRAYAEGLAADAATAWDNSGDILAADTDLDTLANGTYAIWNGDTATALGFPTRSLGTFNTVQFGTGAGTRMWLTRAANPTLWTQSKLSGGWSEWVQVGGASESGVYGLLPASPGSLSRTAISCTTGFGGSSTTGQGFVRALQQVPAGTTRMRVCIRNWNPRYNMADDAAATISNVSIGRHNGGTSQSAAWTLISAGGSTGTDGFKSQWVSLPADLAGTEVLIAFGWSSAGTVQNTIGYGFTGALAADVTTGTAPATNTLPFFIYLEVEVSPSKPKVAVFGDSLASGVSSTRVMFDSWLDQYCRPRGYVPMHWSHSGDQFSNPSDTFNNWLNPIAKKWGLYGTEIVSADAVFMAMGSNLVFAVETPTLQVCIDEITATVALLRTHVSPNVFGCTILPRTAVTGAAETLRRQVNSWMKTSPLFRDVFDMAATVSLDDETLNPSYDADGTHLNTAGYAAMAAAITRPVVGS